MEPRRNRHAVSYPADGTRYVPGTISKAMLPTHAHTYDKANSPTGDWTAPASGGSAGDRGWNPVYQTQSTGSTIVGYHQLTSHTHTIAYTSTNSGTTII